MEQINKNKKRLYYLIAISVLIGIIISIFIFKYEFFQFVLTIYLIVITLILCMFHYYKIHLPFKNNVVKTTLEGINTNIKYCFRFENKSINNEYIKFIKEHRLIPSASTHNITDIITDYIDGIRYTSFDLHSTHTTSNGKTTTTVTDFLGKMYDVELNNTHCNYVLKEEYFKNKPSNFELLDLEHIEFNKQLNLYVTDKFEAQKIFTPSIIMKLFDLINRYPDKNIIAHVNNHLYILLYNQENHFEKAESIIEEYFKQYNNLKGYVDILKETA